ncbi:MAG: polysaccharide export protein [Tabrizicola sp.]|nr:polysaccharide export protein [Tabrizicola sp.]
MVRLLLRVALVFGLVACAPADGPTTGGVTARADREDVPILSITPNVIAALGSAKAKPGLGRIGGGSYRSGVIRPGDTVSVTVFDTGEQGIFSASDSSSIALGDFVVSESGSIGLPFVGTINIGGMSTIAAQNAVTERLRSNAVNPYAAVNITRKESDSFSVQGAVANSGVFPLSARQERVLDAIALAGGAQGDPNGTLVSVLRGGSSGQQTLAQIMSHPSENVGLLPGDVVIVGGGEASFIADGALVSTGEFNFVEGDLSLAQGVAMAGGLSDARSNPRAVFVFRQLAEGEFIRLREPNDSLRDVTGTVIFRANFSDPVERLRAGKFQMRDGDVLYVGNAPLANIAKFFQIFRRPPEIPAPPSDL